MNVWLISQNVAGNYSTLGWELWIDKRSTSPTFSGGKAYRWMQVNGGYVHEYYGNGFDFRSGTNFLLASGSVNVGHNADGTKTVYVAASADFDLLGACNADGSVPLPTIPRASTTSIVAPYTRDIGTSITLNTNRASSGFTHNIEYSFAGSAYTLIGSNIGASMNWTPDLSLIDDIPNAATSLVTIRTTTYSGATYIGQTTSQFTLKVPDSYVPDFTTILNTEATAGVAANIGKYVQGISTLALEVTGEVGVEGSTIAARKIEVLNGATVIATINADSGTTGVITASGTLTIRGTVTDSRGRTKVKTVDIEVLSYIPPTLSAVSVERALFDGTVDIDDGTYFRVNMNVAVQSLMNTTQRNSLNYRVSTREYGEFSWSLEDSGTLPGTSFNGFVTVGTFSVTQAYDVLVEIYDDFLTSAVIISIPVAAVFMHWDGSDGVGFGKYRENGRIDVQGDAYFSGDIYEAGEKLTTKYPVSDLPAPAKTSFASPQTITPTAWTAIPNLPTISMVLARPCWVRTEMASWMALSGTGDGRQGVRIARTGWTLEPQETAPGVGGDWGAVSIKAQPGTDQMVAIKTILLAAGSYTFTGVAYRNTTPTFGTNYPVMFVTPLRWGD
jgi:hypothetical protein